MNPSDGIKPLFDSRPFCDGRWFACGYRHACLKRQGHDGPCWCCEDYPGGDLAVLEREVADA